jgi:hypothetical protein
MCSQDFLRPAGPPILVGMTPKHLQSIPRDEYCADPMSFGAFEKQKEQKEQKK